MKKSLVLLTSLLALNAYADIIDIKPHITNYQCYSKKWCNVQADFDVTIVNQTNVTQHYPLFYSIELPYGSVIPGMAAVKNEGETVNIAPMQTLQKHHTVYWNLFLDRPGNYLITATGGMFGNTNTWQKQLATIWLSP